MVRECTSVPALPHHSPRVPREGRRGRSAGRGLRPGCGEGNAVQLRLERGEHARLGQPHHLTQRYPWMTITSRRRERLSAIGNGEIVANNFLVGEGGDVFSFGDGTTKILVDYKLYKPESAPEASRRHCRFDVCRCRHGSGLAASRKFRPPQRFVRARWRREPYLVMNELSNEQ